MAYRHCFLCMALLLGSFCSLAQTNVLRSSCIPEPDTFAGLKVYQQVDTMAQYPGGETTLMDFFIEHIALADQSHYTGTVYVTFIIDTAGKVQKPCIYRSAPGQYITLYQQEALRIAALLQPFTPAVYGGKKVQVRLYAPVKFK